MARPSPLILFVSVACAVLLAWFVWSAVVAHTGEQPAFTVIERAEGYEIRSYPAYLVAQVSMKAEWSAAIDEGSHILADYLHGNNIEQKSIATTTSVGIELEPESEHIALTAPVLSQEKNGAFLVSFILPAEYTSATIPRPNNPEIRIVEVPATTFAVLSVKGNLTSQRAQQEEESFRELLMRDKRVILSASRVAQYSPSWTPSFLRRSEILIPVR